MSENLSEVSKIIGLGQDIMSEAFDDPIKPDSHSGDSCTETWHLKGAVAKITGKEGSAF